MNKYTRIATIIAVFSLAAGTLSGCGGGDPIPVGIDTANPGFTVMTSATRAEPAGPESPVVQEMKRYLAEKMSEKYGKEYETLNLDIQWTAASAYDEKVTAAMGANEYPHAMLIKTRNSSVIQNSKAGTFWDITDYFKKTDPKYVSEENPEGYVYPYLAQANETINRNISVDGRIYGVYTSRELGRQGVTIRKDWLDNLGLDVPKTVDDLEEVLRAFTEDDPDGNGVDDTYGMIVTVYLEGPLNNLAVWLGAPNEWGYDEESQSWKPAFMSEAYFEALTKLREWYAAGYINKNMATLDSNDWDNDFLNGLAGVQIDVADRAKKNATNILGNNPDAEVDVFGYVTRDENSEPRVWPTTGYGGYYVFPKSTVGDEQDLDFILSVLDECNSEYVLDLCNYGLEGRNYTLDENGKVVKNTEPSLVQEYADLPQFSMGIVPIQLGLAYTNKVDEKLQSVYDDNKNYVVVNPMEPYTSDSYSISGTQLDAIIEEVQVNYITGRIDEDGYRDAVEQWIKMDGDLVCKDYQDAYESDESNLDENGNVVIPDEYKYDYRY